MKVKEVKVNGVRYIVCLNPRQARKDAEDRKAIIASLEEKLKTAPKALVGNKGYRKISRWAGTASVSTWTR